MLVFITFGKDSTHHEWTQVISVINNHQRHVKHRYGLDSSIQRITRTSVSRNVHKLTRPKGNSGIIGTKTHVQRSQHPELKQMLSWSKEWQLFATTKNCETRHGPQHTRYKLDRRIFTHVTQRT